MTPSELVMWWLEKLYKNKYKEEQRIKALRQTITLKNKGYTSKQIKEMWEDWIKKNDKKDTRGIEINQVFKDNLLSTTEKYRHPKLLHIPDNLVSFLDKNRRVVHLNINNEEITQIKSFTIQELVSYYYSKFPKVNKNNYKKDKGALNYLLKQYGVDKLLFIIDGSSSYYLSKDMMPPKSPLNIIDYDHFGISAYEDKLNYV